MRFILVIVVVGILLPGSSYAGIQEFDFAFSPQNQSDVSPERREPYTAAMLTVGKVVVSAWKVIQKETSIKIQVTNLQGNGELKDPQWYSLHGHASVIPQLMINGGGEVAEMQFDKTVGGNQGAEGALSYTIGPSNGKAFLIVMWRVPQFGVYENLSFYVKIEKNAVVDREYLRKLNEDATTKKSVTWNEAQQFHQYQAGTNGAYTWNAAMGTQNVVTLRVALTKGRDFKRLRPLN